MHHHKSNASHILLGLETSQYFLRQANLGAVHMLKENATLLSHLRMLPPLPGCKTTVSRPFVAPGHSLYW